MIITPFGGHVNVKNDYFLHILSQGIVLGSQVRDLKAQSESHAVGLDQVPFDFEMGGPDTRFHLEPLLLLWCLIEYQILWEEIVAN